MNQYLMLCSFLLGLLIISCSPAEQQMNDVEAEAVEALCECAQPVWELNKALAETLKKRDNAAFTAKTNEVKIAFEEMKRCAKPYLTNATNEADRLTLSKALRKTCHSIPPEMIKDLVAE